MMGSILGNLARLVGAKTKVEIDQESGARWSGTDQRRVSDALKLIRTDRPECRLGLLRLESPARKGKHAARYAVLQEAWGHALVSA